MNNPYHHRVVLVESKPDGSARETTHGICHPVSRRQALAARPLDGSSCLLPPWAMAPICCVVAGFSQSLFLDWSRHVDGLVQPAALLPVAMAVECIWVWGGHGTIQKYMYPSSFHHCSKISKGQAKLPMGVEVLLVPVVILQLGSIMW